MKTNKEFQAAVYEKREQALRAKKRSRKVTVSACAAFLLLVLAGGGYWALSGAAPRISPSSRAPIALSVKVLEPDKLEDFSTARLWALPPESSDYDRILEKGKRLEEENKIAEEFPEAVNLFAQSLSPLLIGENENACFSPLSIYYALALASSGAKGETGQEFLDVLHAPDSTWLTEQCAKFYRTHYRDNVTGKLTLANSVWMDGHTAFQNSFLETSKDSFYASLFQADFADPALGNEMTNWVSDNTGGLLKPELAPNPDEVLAIINALYLCDQWSDEFNESQTQEGTFTKGDGSTVSSEFMHKEQTGYGYRGDGFIRASLGLRNSGEMIFVLPDEGVSPASLLSDPERFEEMFFPGTEEFSTTLKWTVPKFSLDGTYQLKDALTSLGLEKAFDVETADFSGMTESLPLSLSRIQHGASISIDEKGVEAAAYTVIYACGGAMPPEKELEMKLDRPFLFAIRTQDSIDDPYGLANAGALLFVGVCGDPTKS